MNAEWYGHLSRLGQVSAVDSWDSGPSTRWKCQTCWQDEIFAHPTGYWLRQLQIWICETIIIHPPNHCFYLVYIVLATLMSDTFPTSQLVHLHPMKNIIGGAARWVSVPTGYPQVFFFIFPALASMDWCAGQFTGHHCAFAKDFLCKFPHHPILWSHGGFRSHGGTPSHHPIFDGKPPHPQPGALRTVLVSRPVGMPSKVVPPIVG